jgi:hypothetical protein
MLLGGRNCTTSQQCIGMQCREEDETSDRKKCFGRSEGKTCYENSDCDRGLFCERNIIFPFENTCEKLRTTYELCEKTEECQLNLYCWYGYKDDVSEEITNKKKLKKCLPMFSQFPEAIFGWRRLNFNGPVMQLEYDLTDENYKVYPNNTLEGKPVFEDY